jgi:hypothetical protein
MTDGFRISKKMVALFVGGFVIYGLSGGLIVILSQWLDDEGFTGERRHIEEAALRPDRAHFRPIEGPLPPAGRQATTYVPIYSTIYLGERDVQAGLAVTLSVRNTSPDHELVVHRLDYYDTAGNLVESFADQPHAVPVMATAEFLIDAGDPVGGPGANYLVQWSVPESGPEPLIEAVMIGRSAAGNVSLIVRGARLHEDRPAADHTEHR